MHVDKSINCLGFRSFFCDCLLIPITYRSERSASFPWHLNMHATKTLELLRILNLVASFQGFDELLVASDIQIHSYCRLHFAKFGHIYKFEIWSALIHSMILSFWLTYFQIWINIFIPSLQFIVILTLKFEGIVRSNLALLMVTLT